MCISNYPLRKADSTYEFPLRCGFLNETYSPITDETAVSVASEVSIADLQEQGLWPLIQLVVRTVLAEGAQFTKDVYLAGTGLGGSHAALVSMWLKRPGEICWIMLENVFVYPGKPVLIVFVANQLLAYPPPIVAVLAFKCTGKVQICKEERGQVLCHLFGRGAWLSVHCPRQVQQRLISVRDP